MNLATNVKIDRQPTLCSASPPEMARAVKVPRCAFTLVEMLVVVAIIAILASVLLGALFVATEHAREERTHSLISKLHNQMMQRWEEYETRRVPLVIPPGTQPRDVADAQLIFLREIMRMELPDRYDDLNLQHFNPANTALTVRFQNESLAFNWQQLPLATLLRPDPHGATPNEQEYLPSLTRSYQQRVIAVAVANGADPTDAVELVSEIERLEDANQSAEMLHLILTTAAGDEDSGGVHFSQKDMGDTDADGMLEFVDAWGNPIRWMRWPSGFLNDATTVGLTMASGDWGLVTDFVSGDPDEDPDPLDPLRLSVVTNSQPGNVAPPAGGVLRTGYRIVPLIMSAGPDGEFGIRLERNEDTAAMPPAALAQVIAGISDPYYWWQFNTEIRRRGMPAKVNVATGDFDPDNGEWVHLDNITNHLLEAE